MDDTRELKMFCRLIFSVACFLAVIQICYASHVVNFKQLGNQLSVHERSEEADHVRRRRSDITDSERKDEVCEKQHDDFLKEILSETNGRRLEEKVCMFL
jgi:hypothetical protein